MVPNLRKLAAGLMLTGACAVAHAAISPSPLGGLFSGLTLKSNPNGIVGDGDDLVVGSTSLAGTSISLNVGPTAAGNYFLVVSGSVPSGFAGGIYSGGITVSPIPEPETYGLFLAGLGLLGTIMSRRRRGA